MRQILLRFILVFFLPISLWAQNGFKGYFSYAEIKAVTQSESKVFFAAENALFAQDAYTHQITTYNTINGLPGETISAVYYAPTANRLLIGYQNGLMAALHLGTGQVTRIVDILNKNLPPNIKRINHMSQHGDWVYISTDFGICQFNPQTLQFGDTYYIGQGTAEIAIAQTAVQGEYIYAATKQNGIRRAEVNSTDLIDANQWVWVADGNWAGIQSVGNELVALTSQGQLQRFQSSAFVPLVDLQGGEPVDFRLSSNKLLVVLPYATYVFNTNLVQEYGVGSNQVPNNNLWTTAAYLAESLYLGSQKQGVWEYRPGSVLTDITPEGPLRNNIFKLTPHNGSTWMVYGDYDFSYNPHPETFMGITQYHNEIGWTHIPYEEVHAQGKQAANLVDITFHPTNSSIFYASSYHHGLLKFDGLTLNNQYDHTNTGTSGLESVNVPGYTSVRIEQSAFDRSGNLWMTNGLVNKGLKVLRASGQWQSYDLSSVINSISEDRWRGMVIDRNGTKWFGTYNNGVVGFNENGNIARKISTGTDTGNLPHTHVRALAIDNNNQLWIGSVRGLRVLSSVDRFLNTGSNLNANSIIILDTDGVAQELFYQQFITDICVDGANNKWVGTADAGVFLVSPDGQETLYHFTTANSPLPSNYINDIEINGQNGEVFIATDKGMISFGGTYTDASENLNDVYVYPNPVRPEYYGTVKVANLVDKAIVKITDITGNLVYETTAEGGTIEWDTTAFGKYKVASGVYMIFISSKDALETKIKKVMIIR